MNTQIIRVSVGALSVALMLSAHLAYAADELPVPPVAAAVTDAGASPAARLAALNSEAAVLEVELHVAELKRKIRDANAPAALGGAMSSAIMPNLPNLPNAGSLDAAPAVQKGLSAVSISAYDGRYQAIVSDDGAQRLVHIGDKLDDWLVSDITDTMVVLKRGKVTRELRV
ncbi:hypothetical protein [Robbsia andropogonis]|nr:hypothetical protein [Robbsia andropogonis]